MRYLLSTFVLFTVLSYLPLVLSCGVTTHNVIAHRASQWFLSKDYPQYSSIITKHLDAFQTGAAFPDWGYDCFVHPDLDQLPDASEAAHWPPFHNTTVKYIREHYPQPWDDKTEKFVAFLLGMVSHAVADILWHDLAVFHYFTPYWKLLRKFLYFNLSQMTTRTRQGFIQALADANYNAHGNQYNVVAHEEADTGGEFMCAYELNLDFLKDFWYVPSQDVANIYQQLNFTQVTPFIIDSCLSELYAEVHAIKLLPSELLYPHFAAQAPFLVEQYQDWFMGGVNDMSVWTTACWPQTIDWLEQGPSEKICYVESHSSKMTHYTQYHKKWEIQARQKAREVIGPYKKFVEVIKEPVEGGTVFKHVVVRNPKEKAQDHPESLLKHSLKRDYCISEEGTSPHMKFLSDQSHSLLGYRVTSGDYNKDGISDVSMAAIGYTQPGNPQLGAVYTMFGSRVTPSEVVVVQQINNNVTHVQGKQTNERHGFSLQSLDFNLDGYDDLIVCSPGTDFISLSYYGVVSIYFGSAAGLSTKADIVVQTNMPYSNLGTPPLLCNTGIGSSLDKGDVDGDGNDDLIVGSPFAKSYSFESGEIWVFLSSKLRSKGQILGKHDADWSAAGTMVFDWFGYKSAVGTYRSKRFLFVGAPSWNNGSNSFGKLYAFDITEFNTTEGDKRKVPLLFSIEGTDALGQLGRSFAVGKPVDTRLFLALGIPTKMYPKYYFWDEDRYQAGAVLVLDVTNMKGVYSANELQPYVTFEGDMEFARLGWGIEFVTNRQNLSDLIISQPWKHANEWLSGADAGAIYLYQGGANFPTGIVTDLSGSSNWCMQAESTMALFGTSFAPLDFNGDGRLDIVVGGPRDHQISENSGAVSILFNVL